MKRFTLILVMLVAYSGVSHGQILISLLFGDKLNTPSLEFGIHAGLNMTTISNIEPSKYAGFLSLGFYFDIRINDNWRFHPELLVKSTSGARGLDPYLLGIPDLDDVLVDSKVRREIGYFQVPLLIKYKFKYGFGIEGGIQPAMRTSATDIFSHDIIENDDLTFENDLNDDITRFDFGLTGGISWRPYKTQGLTIVVRYTYGLVDILKDNPGAPQRNSGFVVSGLIPIGVKKAEAARVEKEANGEG